MIIYITAIQPLGSLLGILESGSDGQLLICILEACCHGRKKSIFCPFYKAPALHQSIFNKNYADRIAEDVSIYQ